MKIKIARIDEQVVTCNIVEENIVTGDIKEDSTIDVGRRWFAADIKVGDIIEFDMTK